MIISTCDSLDDYLYMCQLSL